MGKNKTDELPNKGYLRKVGRRKVVDGHTLETREPLDEIYVQGVVGDTTSKVLESLAKRNSTANERY